MWHLQFCSVSIIYLSFLFTTSNQWQISFCAFLYSTHIFSRETDAVVGNPVTGHPSLVPIFGAYLFAYCLFDLVLVLRYIGLYWGQQGWRRGRIKAEVFLHRLDDLGDTLIITHHIMIAAWLANSGLNHANFGAGAFFMTNEISTVFLNFRYFTRNSASFLRFQRLLDFHEKGLFVFLWPLIRWFFHKIVTSPNAKENSVPSGLVTLNLLLFAVSFFFTRVLGNTYMTFNAIYQVCNRTSFPPPASRLDSLNLDSHFEYQCWLVLRLFSSSSRTLFL